jgi:4-hydroxybenzoate polyprenyltransferase
MIEQTLFGLPWALIGALIPFANSNFKGPSLWTWCLVLVAFISARTSGMSFNRLIDYEIDLANQRTKSRPLQSGEITKGQVTVIAFLSLIIFLLATLSINSLCFIFAPFAAFLLVFYSFTKRFGSYCHFVLGLVEFFAPFLGYIAITSTISYEAVFLGFAIFFWISGMDIMYSTQDEVFDRENGLYSIPVKIGAQNSFKLARLLHALTVFCLILVGIWSEISFSYFIGVAFVCFLFIYQHRIVQNNINQAFFTANSLIAVVQFIFTLVAIL